MDKPIKQPKSTKEETRAIREETKKDKRIFFDLIRRLKAKGIEYTLLTT